MKIAIVGASGNVGTHLLAEARRRGHAVTTIVRDPGRLAPADGVRIVQADAGNAADLAAALRGHDVAISALPFRTTDPATLIEAVRQAAVPRYLVVGGAGSLEVAPGRLLIDTSDFPEAFRAEAARGRDFLDALRATTDLAWTMLSPSALLQPGDRTGQFRLGEDRLLVGPDGTSRISYADFAIAMLDEVEHPTHVRRRFTVGY